MATTRVFFCHAVDPASQQDVALLTLLYTRLQDLESDIVAYPDHPGSEDFLDFVQQQLPTCQWFLVLQTPGLAVLPQVQRAIDMALDRLDQRQLRSVLRVVCMPDADQEAPAEWATLPTFDATYDPLRAVEKLLLSLSTTRRLSLAPPPAVALSLTPTYDRPPTSPSRLARVRAVVRNRSQDLMYAHKRAVIVVSLLLLVLLGGSLLFTIVARGSPARAQPRRPAPGTPTYGEVSFFSTDMAGTQLTTGIVDGIHLALRNLAPPASGKSYYAWLLPDTQHPEGPHILVGKFVPTQGRVTLSYQDPDAANLLASAGRLLITEENTSSRPSFPTVDVSKWRYYGAFPQQPNPQDTNHFSALDHLRHLLSNDDMTSAMSLPGGLGVWLLQNLRLVFTWASDARGSGTQIAPARVHSDAIMILDALDGAEAVGLDLPRGTPLLVDSTVARKPVLTLDPNAAVPGYLFEVDTHLLGFSTSPGTTHKQQTLAGKISGELDAVQRALQQLRRDAKQLATKTSKALLNQSTMALLDDLVNQASIAYDGRQNPATSTTQAGITLIFVQIQQLAQFSLVSYTHQMQA